ncbi:hypothetical protein AWB80_03581 [Caballeronia pedi]|uniref:Uncharacterized protein n=1 Tax=Caballeronia pedi TaxID=1777141 RepID=A0A158BHM1_9BURK|nr:hypothetical protein AWB80_03581 [Caballeronia pedi]
MWYGEIGIRVVTGLRGSSGESVFCFATVACVRSAGGLVA